MARWFTHTGVLEAAGLVLNAASPSALDQVKKTARTSVMALRSSAGAALPQQLVEVADAFQSLQVARHSADYDGNYDPVRAVTISHVRDAEAALQAAWYLWRGAASKSAGRQSAAAAYRTFLRLALLRSGGPRAR